MFIEEFGDFWKLSENADALVCTINCVCRADGDLVMGAGIAKEFANRYPWLPATWGERNRVEKIRPENTYPLVYFDNEPVLIGMHTKYHWKEKSLLALVDKSLQQLYNIVNSLGLENIYMTKPGCGLGGLSWKDEVRPLAKRILDERFTIVDKKWEN